MNKLLLLLSTSLVPMQGTPLLIKSIQNQVDNMNLPDSYLKMYTTKKESGVSNFAASLNNLFIHNRNPLISQKDAHRKLQWITGDPNGANISGNEEKVNDWINEVIGRHDEKKKDYFKVEKVPVEYLSRENLAHALVYSVGWKNQPIILQSKHTSLIIMGYSNPSKGFYVTNHDYDGRLGVTLWSIIDELTRGRDEEVFVVAEPNTLRTIKLQPRVADEIGLVKQEMSYYHFPAAIKSLILAYHLNTDQTAMYKWLREITGTPANIEGVVIRDQEVSDYLNKHTSANFGTFNLGQGFGVVRDEVVAFNKSIEASLKKGNPLILTNHSHSFVISEIAINESNPWLTTITGMNPEKGEMVSVPCQKLTWFNRENTHLIGEKEAISQNITVKSAKVAIEQKTIEMNNLEGGFDVKAFESEINLTALTSVQSISKIKQNFLSFELPEFNAQIFKIDGNVEEKQGLILTTSQLPDNDVDHWQGAIENVFIVEDKTTNEKIKTWVKARMIINQDFVGDLILTIQVLVGADVTTAANRQAESQRLSGKIVLDSGKIFKLNR